MSLRARFGFKDNGTPQARIVVPGADIDAATLPQIVFDADFAAVRVAYSGYIAWGGDYGLDLQAAVSWPDMGFVPYTLIAAFADDNGFGYFKSYYNGGSASGPYAYTLAENCAIMPTVFLDEVPESTPLNTVVASVGPAGFDAAVCFYYDGWLSYIVFAFPAG